MSPRRGNTGPAPLSATDWHVLMALLEEDLHGYAIMKVVERASGGAVSAEIGSLYRILSRMMTDGLVDEVAAPRDAPTETGVEHDSRLRVRVSDGARAERIQRFLAREVWSRIPAAQLGCPPSREERERILGFGQDGV